MMKPDYRLGYTLNDNLEVETEVRAYVRDQRSSNWDQLRPDHRYSSYIKSSYGKVWHHADY